jgi:hypothetical protein
MITIKKTQSGLLLQRDGVAIQLDSSAVRLALGAVIAELEQQAAAIGAARLEAYNNGLAQGYQQAQIERATLERIAQRQQAELSEQAQQRAVEALAA